MGNVVLANAALSDAAVITAGSQLASLPVTNLQTDQPSEVWRTDGLDNAWVEADFGAATQINLASMLYTNLTSAATIQLRAAATQAALTAGPAYDSTAITAWLETSLGDWPFIHSYIWLGAAPQSYRWWRIDLVDAANPDGYIQAGRLIVDDGLQAARNLQNGWSVTYVDPSPHHRATNGALWATPRDGARLISYAHGFLTEDEMYDKFFDVDRTRGTKKSVLVIRDPDALKHGHKQMVYGLVNRVRPIRSLGHVNYAKKIEIEEML